MIDDRLRGAAWTRRGRLVDEAVGDGGLPREYPTVGGVDFSYRFAAAA
ncbi:MAG TPA: hypothetical protein VMU65_11360 [Candidatus Saccharimonadales bacterium]|nr:hypothetical protein [Candidatus Saccharimonadales bacterium]